MLETKEQKQYLAAIVVLVVILGLISFVNKPQFLYKNQPQVATKKFDYNAYLASIKIDPVASQKLYENLISEDDVRKDMEAALQVNQKITLPVIEDSKIKITKDSGTQPVVDYMKSVNLIVDSLSNSVQPNSKSIFDPSADPSTSASLADSVNGLIAQYYKTSVPKDAAVFHKSYIASLETFSDLLQASKVYQTDPSVDPWPRLYKDYQIMDREVLVMGQEYKRLDQKYSFNEILRKEQSGYAQGSFLVSKADAFLGFTLTIDIFQKAQEILKEALTSAFAQFAVNFLNGMIDKVESNYKIANFLYYSDALVSGQYVDDYLDKYVKDPLDRVMVKNFIPQISCGGNNASLKTVFKAKADQYLGFDPESVDPSDPDYFTKMSKIGSFLSTPNGWQLYYQDLADQAEAQAKDAADKELTSNGFKSSRDPAKKGEIATSAASALESLRGAINAYFELGVSNASSPISRLASSAIQTFVNKFVFKGAVLKEQSVCIAAPQIQPVLPAQNTAIPPVPPTPTEDQIRQQECAQDPVGCQFIP